MPVELLQELETTPPVAGSLENVEDLVRVVAREVCLAVEGMKGSAFLFEKAWQRIVIDVAAGHTTAMQVLRSRFVSAFEKRLGLLKETHTLATWLRKRASEQVPDPEVLLPEIAGMDRLQSSVLDHWQTADDLEELAARDYPLTTADLDQIGPTRRPAASFYAEESKPF